MLQQLSQEEKRSQMNWEKENFEHLSKHLVNYLHKSGCEGEIKGVNIPLYNKVFKLSLLSLHTTQTFQKKNMRGQHWRAGVQLTTAYHVS